MTWWHDGAKDENEWFEGSYAQHIAITDATKSLDDDDAVYAAFNNARAKKLRTAISPGFPSKP